MANKQDVTIRVGADMAGAIEGIGKLVGKFSSLATKGNIIKGVFGGAFAYGAKQLGNMIDEVSELNHELIIASRNSGASVENLQGWARNAKKYGKSMEDVVLVMEKLQLAKEKALQEGPQGKMAKAFEKMGISRQELSGMSNEELFKKMNEELSKGAGLMAHMTQLADIFGAKMVKNLKFLEQSLEGAKEKLRQRGALLDENTALQIEKVRAMDSEMGKYSERFVRPEHRQDMALAWNSFKAMSKAAFVFLDEAFSTDRKTAATAGNRFFDRMGQLQADQGYRMGPGWVSPKEYADMEKRNRLRQERHAELKSSIEDLQTELLSPTAKLAKAKSEVARLQSEYDKYPAAKTSNEKLQAQRDLLAAQLEVKKMEGTPGQHQFVSNPFLQIGGLLGVDTSARIADDMRRTADNTGAILDNMSRGTGGHESPQESTFPDMGGKGSQGGVGYTPPPRPRGGIFATFSGARR